MEGTESTTLGFKQIPKVAGRTVAGIGYLVNELAAAGYFGEGSPPINAISHAWWPEKPFTNCLIRPRSDPTI